MLSCGGATGASRLLGRPDSGTVILTSGTLSFFLRETGRSRGVAAGGVAVPVLLSVLIPRRSEGAGTTPVTPSGPSVILA